MKIDILRDEFGTRSFSLREARVALGPAAKMTLSRLVLDGRLERVGRGIYRIAAPERRAGVARARAAMWRDQALAAPVAVALDGPDAVAAWTGGRYHVARGAPDEVVVWLAVKPADEKRLREWLRERDWSVGTADAWPEGRGPKAVVRTVPGLPRVVLDGRPVLAQTEVRRIIEADPVAYEGAEAWLIER